MTEAEPEMLDLTGPKPEARTRNKEIRKTISDEFGEANVFIDLQTGRQGIRNRPVWVACYKGHDPSILIRTQDGHLCEECETVYTADVFETALLAAAIKPTRSVRLEAV